MQCACAGVPQSNTSVTVLRGRKKAALTYVVTYCIGCATKHWNMFIVLLVGRLFCGVATSLLYSAFESWLVAEHFKVRTRLPVSEVFLALGIQLLPCWKLLHPFTVQ